MNKMSYPEWCEYRNNLTIEDVIRKAKEGYYDAREDIRKEAERAATRRGEK